MNLFFINSFLAFGYVGVQGQLTLVGFLVGFALGYALTSAPELLLGEGGVSHMVSGKIGYTGSDDFELGLRYTYHTIEVSSIDDKASVGKISLLLKFYF